MCATSAPQAGCFRRLVLESPTRLALLIATYPGLALTRAKVSDIVTNARAQRDAQAALHARYGATFALTAMDQIGRAHV